MAANLNYKQVANVSRRTWDKDAYEQRARSRQEQEEAAAAAEVSHLSHRPQHRRPEDESSSLPAAGGGVKTDASEAAPEFVPADASAAGPEGSDRAYLKARQKAVDLESKVGTSRIVAPTAAASLRPTASSSNSAAGTVTSGLGPVGWHCAVCDCVLKDSHTYLDHINGRKHQRKLGYSMRVERSSKDQVLDKLKQLTRQKEETSATTPFTLLDQDSTQYGDASGKVRSVAASSNDRDGDGDRISHDQQPLDDKEPPTGRPSPEEQQGDQRDRDPVNANEDDDVEDDDDEVAAEVDPALAAMMGFAGFGGGQKNR